MRVQVGQPQLCPYYGVVYSPIAVRIGLLLRVLLCNMSCNCCSEQQQYWLIYCILLAATSSRKITLQYTANLPFTKHGAMIRQYSPTAMIATSPHANGLRSQPIRVQADSYILKVFSDACVFVQFRQLGRRQRRTRWSKESHQHRKQRKQG